MANQELLPVPYDHNKEDGLVPLQRRALTRQSERNLVLYEVGALLPLGQDEARQIGFWANNAAGAIEEIRKIVLGLPGEVKTSTAEQLEEKISETGKTDRHTGRSTSGTIRGFFTIHYFEESTEGTEEQTLKERQRTQERTREQTAKTRPGQLLTGGQVRDALERVDIADREGLLLLPAAHSELKRRQNDMLQIVKRVLEDHSESNLAWAADIQEGAVEGLISQLDQAVENYQNGYFSEELKKEIEPNIRETMDKQVWSILESSFLDLARFSLIEGKEYSIIKAGRRVQQCLLEDIYPGAPLKFIDLMNKWFLIFLGEKPVRNAQIIGKAFAETFAEGVIRSQEEETIFRELDQLSDMVVQNGGAGLLLEALFAKFGSKRPNAGTVLLARKLSGVLMGEVKNHRNLEPNLISLIRFSLTKEINSESPELTGELISLLSQASLSTKTTFWTDYFDQEFSLSTLFALSKALTKEEWEVLGRKAGKSPEEIIIRVEERLFSDQPPLNLSELKNQELARTLQGAFYRGLSCLLDNEPAVAEALKHDKKKAFIMLFEQLTSEQRLDLTERFKQVSQRTIEQALSLINDNLDKIILMARCKLLVEADDGRRPKLPDWRLVDTLGRVDQSSFHRESLKYRLDKLRDVYYVLSSYESKRWRIVGRKESDKVRQAFEQFFNRDFEKSHRRLYLLYDLTEIFSL